MDSLPPAEGFFVGSNKVDDRYFDNLRCTVSHLKKISKYPNNWDFQYHSSW